MTAFICFLFVFIYRFPQYFLHKTYFEWNPNE